MKQKGFTLIEMLTAMSIFVLVSGLLLGLFFSSLNLQRRAFSSRDLQDNAKFILDLMSKEIRTGADFSLLGTELRFTNDRGVSVRYGLSGAAIQRWNGVSYETLTSTTANVNRLDFLLFGQGANDGQPRVTIILKINPTANLPAPSLETQTTISSRELDDAH